MSTRQFGEPIERNADPALLRGEGSFIDDIDLPGALHVAFVRSTVARAKILSVDTFAAETLDGVVRVYTCDSIGALDAPLPLLIPNPDLTHPRTQRPLARDEVFYVGQCIVMVVAVDRYVAEDAVRLIDIDYDPLPVEMDLERAVEDDAPRVHPDVPNNTAGRFRVETGDADAAFAEAEHITRVKIRLERSTAAPLECRAIAARWEAVTGELTVWDSTQSTVSVRGALATVLRIDEDKVRVIAPNVGGGFGQKIMMFYPDELLVPLASMELGRPVKYIEDRVENFIGSSQERTQIHTLELAATNDGRVIGLKDDFLHDTGAFIPYGIAVAQVSSTSIAGPYRIPNFRVTFRPVYMPTVQVTPYRGCGRPHACYAIERAMDQLAGELGLDRFEVRRRNFIGRDEFPYPREGVIFADGLQVIHDSGAYEEALDRLSEALDVEGFRAEQAAAREERALYRPRLRVLRGGHRARPLRGRTHQGSPDHRQGLRQHRAHRSGPGSRDGLRPDRR